MNEFQAIDLSNEAPSAICRTCAANGIEHIPTGLVAVHCDHRQVGVWKINGAWKASVQPIDAERFGNVTLLEILEGEQRYLQRTERQK